MTRLTSSDVARVTLALTLALGVVGAAWCAWRLGLSDDALTTRLEHEVRRAVHQQVTAVRTLSQRVSTEGTLVTDATESRQRLSDLFERLGVLASADQGSPTAVTVYVPEVAAGTYRVLAWSDGPGEQNLTTDRLSGPSAIFVAPGYAGLRLVAVEPVTVDGVAVAVAVAETVLAPADRRLHTSFGAVRVIEHYAGTGDTTTGTGFVVTSPEGAPLIEVGHEWSALHAHRRAVLARVAAIALLPLPLGLSVAIVLRRARRAWPATARAKWERLAWSTVATLAITSMLVALARLGGLPDTVGWFIAAVGPIVIVTLVPSALWWQAARWRRPPRMGGRFLLEQVAGGLVLAVGLEGVARLLERWITLAVLDRGPFVTFPLAPLPTLSAGTVLLVETTVAWITAIVLGALTIRWRLLPIGQRTLVAAACWLAPVLVLSVLPVSSVGRAGLLTLGIAMAAVVASLSAARLRRTHRRSTQSVRLGLALLAGLVPLLVLYPLAASVAERTTRRIIATEYAPAAADHPQQLLGALQRAQEQVDQLTFLPQLVSALPSTDSRPAHHVWTQTGLDRQRMISLVELYGPDRALVSRFAFNLPEYLYRTALRPWEGSSCDWRLFGVTGPAYRRVGEVTPVGAVERAMLHAERGVCDETGELLGGIVLHVASPDYQALPFITSPSPYADVISADEPQPSLPDVRLAVYGWSSQPIFTSDRTVWAVPADVFDRLYRTGEPFWTSLSSGDVSYDVHFSQNRAGVYAVGVPHVTAVEHATRLAEVAGLAALFFACWQIALLLQATLARQPGTPLGRLFDEVRTSFYRKVFISFVVVAVVPVVSAAVAFGGYMSARFRADVEYEASNIVTVAGRVFEETVVPVDLGGGTSAALNDDVMVWIRQVTGHDVNLFNGPELVITSQRNLFDSGFLATRTPAAAYRAIALERRPSFVANDTSTSLSYIVAAAPVPAWGPDAVLTVPLAPRQREMERELDTLNRRVLVGTLVVVLIAAGIGASLAGRIADPVARLSRATRQIAAGNLDVRVAAETADELRRLVDDFNSMAATLGAQRAELARANQLKAWNEMARQVAHEIKNPLTPVQLAAEHLQHVHEDRGRPLGAVLDQCIGTVLAQVRLLRQIASEFANFAGEPVSRPAALAVDDLLREIVEPYRVGLGDRVTFNLPPTDDLPLVLADRTLISRALTNLVENAVQAMPTGGSLTITGRHEGDQVVLELVDTGVGLDSTAVEHAFEPYFSTKTGGSGLGLANARRNIEREGGTVTIASAPGKGATVTVTLRAAPRSALPPRAGSG